LPVELITLLVGGGGLVAGPLPEGAARGVSGAARHPERGGACRENRLIKIGVEIVSGKYFVRERRQTPL